MLHADALIFVFPLYIFCLPAILMRFLQDYRRYLTDHTNETGRMLVYAIVNCGFQESDINSEAVRVVRSFSEKSAPSSDSA